MKITEKVVSVKYKLELSPQELRCIVRRLTQTKGVGDSADFTLFLSQLSGALDD